MDAPHTINHKNFEWNEGVSARGKRTPFLCTADFKFIWRGRRKMTPASGRTELGRYNFKTRIRSGWDAIQTHDSHG